MIKIQDNALLRLRELKEKHKKTYVRLDVKGGGCAGFNYEWSFDDEDNRIVIGNNNITNSYVKVDRTTGSDIRDKTDIVTLPTNAGLSFVNQLRPVTYVWDNRDNYYEVGHAKYGERDHSKKDTRKHVGFIAQEVEAIENSMGWTDDHIVDTSNALSYQMQYSSVIPILTKAIQELSAKVEALENG